MENNKVYDAYGNEVNFTQDDFKLVQKDEKIHDLKFDTKPTTFIKDAFRRFCKNKSSVVGAIIISILLLLAFFYPVFSPYDVETIHPSETLLPPKLFEPVKGSLSTNWNGTEYVKIPVPYDPETKLPIVEGLVADAVVTVEANASETYFNKYQKGSAGGTFVVVAKNKVDKVLYLEIYDDINFTAIDNYKLEITIPDLDLSAPDAYGEGETRLDGTKFAEYRIYLEYGEFTSKSTPMKQERVETKEIVLKDWSVDNGEFTFDISKAIEDAGLTEVKNGKIRFEMKSLSSEYTYLPIERVSFSTTSEDEEIINKLQLMGLLSNDEIEEEGFDANSRAGLNPPAVGTGRYPDGFWRTTCSKTVYHNSNFQCTYVYDKYKALYGITSGFGLVGQADMEGYIAKGWCQYDFTVGPESFVVLDEHCPVSKVTEQEFIDDGKVSYYRLNVEIEKYKLLGYTSMPKFLFGTDNDGFDLITKCFDGLRLSLFLSIVVSAICLTFGLCWGAISGYFGGNVDLFMERFCDILGGVPWIVVMTLAILLLGNNIGTFGMALCLTGWMGTAARTRTQFYRFKGREYILASRTLGSSDGRLIFRHILPNAMGTIITGSILSIPGVIFSEATLAYLNLGLRGQNSFGVILSTNQQFLSSQPLLIVFPAIIISLIMISFNLFGNGLRDALNPSLKGSD